MWSLPRWHAPNYQWSADRHCLLAQSPPYFGLSVDSISGDRPYKLTFFTSVEKPPVTYVLPEVASVLSLSVRA